MPLPGALGALIEKDLRATWRDPRLKTLIFTGMIGPLVVLALLWRSAGRLPLTLLVFLASFMGLGVLGANVFALERQGLALLFGFPVARSRLLVAKNLGTMVLRLPGLLLIVVTTLFVAGPLFLPAVGTTYLLTQLVACALDNYVSVLLPVPVPAAGRDPNARVSGTRGLGAALVAFAAMLASLALSAPFTFLAWLPYLLGLPWLWIATLPLALAGRRSRVLHARGWSGATRGTAGAGPRGARRRGRVKSRLAPRRDESGKIDTLMTRTSTGGRGDGGAGGRRARAAPALLALVSLLVSSGACNKGPARTALAEVDQALAVARPELERYVPAELVRIDADAAEARARLAHGRYTDALRIAQELPGRIALAATAADAQQERARSCLGSAGGQRASRPGSRPRRGWRKSSRRGAGPGARACCRPRRPSSPRRRTRGPGRRRRTRTTTCRRR